MASSGAFDIAKAGWLYRQSSVLHRWKRSWFVLDCYGDLRYFENPDNPVAEERIVVRAAVVGIKTGPSCRKADPPEGANCSSNYFLELQLRDKEAMLLCAESSDDMKAWQIALEEARSIATQTAAPAMPANTTTVISAPGYVPYASPYGGYGYPGHVISQGPLMQSQVIYSPNGATTFVGVPPSQQIVYVDDQPYWPRRYYRGGLYRSPFFYW